MEECSTCGKRYKTLFEALDCAYRDEQARQLRAERLEQERRRLRDERIARSNAQLAENISIILAFQQLLQGSPFRKAKRQSKRR